MSSTADIIALCDYWIRLCIKVDIHLKKALLNVFHNAYNDSSYQGLPEDQRQLYNGLKNHHPILTKLKKKGIISNEQWALLFPANQQTDSRTFDITTIVVLIRNCTTLPPPAGGWKQKSPPLTDQSIAAHCLRARDDIRNFVFHYGCITKMNIVEFTQKWNESDVILLGLGYTVNTTDLKTRSLDPHRVDYLKHFTNHLKLGLDSLQTVVDENTTDIKNMKPLASDILDMKMKLNEIGGQQDVCENSLNDLLKSYEASRTQYGTDKLNTMLQFEKHESDLQEVKDNLQELKTDTATSIKALEDVVADKELQDLKIQFQNMNMGPSKPKYVDMFWNVHHNVSNFTGRKLLLTEMNVELNTSKSFPYSAICMSGLGGVGKTEIAARYVHIYRKEYENVFWIQADSLGISLVNLVSYFNIGCNNQSIEVLIQTISKQVRDTKCLFVLDNAENFKSVNPFLKNLNFSKCVPHIIVTSQNSKWLGGSITQIDMNVFTNEEACSFFHHELPSAELIEINELVKELQALPLAMQQAKSYIKKHSISVTKYLEYFKKGYEQLLKVNLEDTGEADYGKTLLTVWKLAFDKLVEHGNTVAVDILNIMAYMDGSIISMKTFLCYGGIEGDIELNEVKEILCQYSLISLKRNETNLIMMHSLVQKIVIIFHEGVQKSNDIGKNYCDLCVGLLHSAAEKHSWKSDPNNIWYPHNYEVINLPS